MYSVDGMSIKIDMPTSQYGTMTVNGRLYNVHVTRLSTRCIETLPPAYEFVLHMTGEEHVGDVEPDWEDSYEAV